MTSANTGPLAGLKVVEMGTLIAGPFCGQILGDFGADVVKIEDPKTGASVQVDLLPLVGDRNAGSQISLAALRLLGFAPSDLAQIVVWRS